MNIFFLHEDPEQAAQMMSDKHIVKMILESAQLLSTAHHVCNTYLKTNKLYKATHVNHPMSIWARESKQNYRWLYQHFCALATEYTKRYRKVHKSYRILNKVLVHPPELPSLGLTVPPQCMPVKYQNENKSLSDCVSAYVAYYEEEKLFTEKDKTRFTTNVYRLLALYP